MMEIRKLGEQIGAEITGVDVTRMTPEEFKAIYDTWLAYNVITVRDQSLDIPAFLTYSRHFGSVHPHPSKSTRHPQYAEITMLGTNKFRTDGTLDRTVYLRGAEGFHTDGAYAESPFKATQLYAVAIPSRGGDTLFASMYAAYDALPAGLRAKIEGRRGAYVYGGRKRSNALLNEEDRNEPAVFHLLARPHPETGRKALYFDPGKILYIEGYSRDESEALIAELEGYMLQPDSQYRHKWRKGDIVIWDNRCSYHKAAGDYPPEEERIHWRVSIKDHGDLPAAEAA
jgi:taurine dioxygenase